MILLKKKHYKPISYFLINDYRLQINGFLGSIIFKVPTKKIKINKIKFNNKFYSIIKFYFRKKGLAFMFLKIFYKNFVGISSGWYTSLELIGRGFSVFFYKNFLLFNLGYSHGYGFFLPLNIKCYIDSQKKNTFLLFASDYQKLQNLSFFIKKLKPLNIYKGTGIKFRNEVFKLKQGKKTAT